MVNNHGDRKSPNWGCGTPYKCPKWLINGGYYLLTKWDDPPSIQSIQVIAMPLSQIACLLATLKRCSATRRDVLRGKGVIILWA